MKKIYFQTLIPILCVAAIAMNTYGQSKATQATAQGKTVSGQGTHSKLGVNGLPMGRNSMQDKSAATKTKAVRTIRSNNTHKHASSYGGNVLMFDGNDDAVQVPYNSELNPPGDFTIEFWARVDGNDGTYRTPLCSRGWDNAAGGGTGYNFYAGDDNHWQFWFGAANANTNWEAITGPAIVDGEWTHLAAVHVAATNSFTFYVDGEAVGNDHGTGSAFEANSTADMYIGCNDGGAGSAPFLGCASELRIWNTARSQSDIRSTMFDTLAGTESGLIACWRLDGTGISTTANDIVGSRNGTLQNFSFLSDGWIPATDFPIGSTVAFAYAATSVNKTSVILNGAVMPHDLSTVVHFLWGTTLGDYTDSLAADESPVSGTGLSSVSKSLSGLTYGVTYYYCVSASNSEGYIRSSEKSCTPVDIWSSGNGTVTFTKADYANYTIAANQDRITDNVWITRADNRQIFNIETESSADGNGGSSPAGTEWAYGTTADINSLTFSSWGNAIGWHPPDMVGRDMVVHLIADNIYLDIKFLSWTSNNSGGGFSYIRAAGPLEVMPLGAPTMTGTSETLSGTVFSLDSAATAYILLGTSSGDYTDSLLASPNPVSAGSRTTVSASFSSLDTATTYYFCVAASNGSMYKRSGELTFRHATIWSKSNGTITFTKSNHADWTHAENQDRITDNVWITRADNRQIFNIETESSADGNGGSSPAGTEWAYGTTADINSLTFSSWGNAIGWDPPAMIGRDMVVHLIADNVYVDVKFLSWTVGPTWGMGPGGGGFSYVRAGGPLEVVSLPAPLMTGTSDTLKGKVFCAGATGTAYILIGTSSGDYTDSVLATPNSIPTGTQTTVAAYFSGLSTSSTYYFCVAASNGTLYKRSAERSFSHTNAQFWSSNNGTVTFTKANYADYTNAANQDRITDNVWITRANTGWVFNINSESSFNGSWPAGTEWAYGTTADISSLSFDTWQNTIGYNNGNSMVGRDMVVHLIADDIYLDIKFLSWTSNNSGGGFTYVRAAGPLELSASCASGITRNGAVVQGSVYSRDRSVAAYLLYGTTSGTYTDSVLMTPHSTIADSQTAVSVDLSSLTPGVIYYYCIAAANDTLYKRTADQTFMTISNSVRNTLLFNGGQAVTTTMDFSPTALPTATWEAWVMPTGVNYGDFQGILSTDNGGWDRGIWLCPGTTNLIIAYGTDGWQPPCGALNIGTWYHIALVFKPDNVLFYLNGQEYSLGAAPTYDGDSYNFTIGASTAGNSQYFQGEINEVRIWNVARSQTEIESCRYKTLTGTEPGLVAYWQLDECGTIPTAYEEVGGNNGALLDFSFDGITNGWMPTSDLPLPVQATNFLAKSDIGAVTISWSTGSEVDNAGFNILRQEQVTGNATGQTWTMVASYKTVDALKGLGTSTTGRSYSFTDNRVKSSSTYNYKIQCVAMDGAAKDLTTLSGIKVEIPKEYALYQNYPNPFNPGTTIRFDLKQTSSVTLSIYNVLGQRVKEMNLGIMDAGRYNETIDMGGFASGVYYYRIVAAGNPAQVGDNQKFVATKRFMLMK